MKLDLLRAMENNMEFIKLLQFLHLTRGFGECGPIDIILSIRALYKNKLLQNCICDNCIHTDKYRAVAPRIEWDSYWGHV